MRLKIAGLLMLGLMAAQSQAAITLTMTEVGGDVVVSGGGTASLAALSEYVLSPQNLASGIRPNGPYFFGGQSPSYTDLYASIYGPTSFGTGGALSASSGTGDRVGFAFTSTPGVFFLLVPANYVSNSLLSSSTTFAGQTFASMGVTPGSYVWTWGSGGTADSLTLRIGAPEPVPLPAASWLLLSGLGGLGLLRRRKTMRSQMA